VLEDRAQITSQLNKLDFDAINELNPEGNPVTPGVDKGEMKKNLY